MDAPRIGKHQQHGQQKVTGDTQQNRAVSAEKQHQQGLQEQIHRLVAHDRRGQYAVAGKSLEGDRRPGNRHPADHHGCEPGEPLGDHIVNVQARAQEYKHQRQQDDYAAHGISGQHAAHRCLQMISARNNTPPTLPAVRPMGTSNG